MSDQAVQLDLFGHVEAAEQAAIEDSRRQVVAALTCLRDSVPMALEVVVHLKRHQDRDDRKPGKSGDWAFIVSHAGLRYEDVNTWGGWDSRPRNLFTWDRLADAIEQDPRRAEVIQWARSLTVVDRWRDLYRPYELWVDPHTWHPSYIEGDHQRPGWDERIHAWRTTQAILSDAIDAARIVGTSMQTEQPDTTGGMP